MAATLVPRSFVANQAPTGLAYRSLRPAPLAELVIASRADDPSPTLANLLRVVDQVSPLDPEGMPDDGELI